MDGEKANNGDDNNITPRMMVILAPSTPIMGMKPNFQKSMICSTKKKKKKKKFQKEEVERSGSNQRV
jgi:hypothetical protein